ncbi:MAG: hypothetical protein AABZ47_11155 [Planctomycetota bacterium]
MPRIFLCMGFGQLVVVLAAFVLGMLHSPATVTRHVALGVFALLLSCLVQVIVFTYFTVTGKMVAQALHLGRFDLAPLFEVKRLKRIMTVAMACGIASILCVAITGGNHWRTAAGANAHFVTVLVAFCVQVWAFYRQYGAVCGNFVIVRTVLEEYAAMRRSPNCNQHRIPRGFEPT